MLMILGLVERGDGRKGDLEWDAARGRGRGDSGKHT